MRLVIPPLCAAYVRTEGAAAVPSRFLCCRTPPTSHWPIRGSGLEIRRERPVRRSCETLILLPPPIESDKRFLELFSPSRLLDACGMARVTIGYHPVHKTLSGRNRRSGREDVRGVGNGFCSVRAQGSSFLLPVPDPTQSHSFRQISS